MFDMLDRRTILKVGAGAFVGTVLTGCRHCLPADKPLVRFGLVADVHFARILSVGARQYAQSAEKLAHVVTGMNAHRLDFLVELGDFKDLGPTKEETLSYLDEIDGVFRRFKGPRHYVLGNHDTDCLTKDEFLRRVGQAESYYAFERAGVTFVILDGCFTSDGKPYCRANPWEDANIPAVELDWLEKTLAEAPGQVIVFCHQRLDPVADRRHLIRNATEVRSVLEKSGKVTAVFTGHQHGGGECRNNGILYFTLRALVLDAIVSESACALVELYSDGHITIHTDILSDYQKEIKS